VRRRGRERGFERFRGSGGHESINERMKEKTIEKRSTDSDAKSEH
jgi:hypothetical protein